MADYLTRMVERTLGLSPVARPAIPPTFAPETADPPPEPAVEHLPAAHPNPPREPGHHVPDRMGRFEGEGSNPEERDNTLSPTTAGPTRRIGTQIESDALPSETGSADERREAERRPAGARREQRPSPGSTRRARRETEGSEAGPDLREATSFELQLNRPETAADRGERLAKSSETGVRSARRPSTEPDEGGAATPPLLPREARPSGTRATPPGTTGDPGLWVRPDSDLAGRVGRRLSPEPLVPDADVPDELLAPTTASYARRSSGASRVPVRESRGAADTGRPRGASSPTPATTSGQREVGKESSSPTIRVSIGRVEVRAVAPGPAPLPRPAEAEAPPALSLDDYLKNGGRR